MKIKLAQPIIFSTVLVVSLVMVSTAFAKQTVTIRPGWGFGDENHIHIGPPGQSVHPIHIDQTQTVHISNTIDVSANTGGNSGNTNNGSVNIVVTFIQKIGSNIFHF